MIVEAKKRREKLLSAGVPPSFLDAMEDPSAFEELAYLARYPEGFYLEMPRVIGGYSILRGYAVTPVYEDGNGDIYSVLLSSDEETRFVRFPRERDEIYKDFGADFQYMLADLLIEYYEFATDLSVEVLSAHGERIGCPRASRLFKALADAEGSGARRSFELDNEWRRDVLPGLVG